MAARVRAKKLSVYADSSALVKVYLDEPGAPEMRALLAENEVVITSVIALPEQISAVRRASAGGRIEAGRAEFLRGEILSHWADMMSVGVNEATLRSAVDVAWRFGLPGFDAVHLGSALAFNEGLDKPITFATFDRVLWRAARESGLEAWPPEVG